MKIQRVGLASAFKIGFVVYGVLGLVFGLLAAAVLILFSAAIMAALETDFSQVGIVFAVVLPLVFSLALAFAGGWLSFLAALTYNIAAGLLGGIEVHVEEEKLKIYDDMYGEIQ